MSEMTLQERIDNYVRVTKYPRSLFLSEDGRIVGTWVMGNDYRVKSRYHGGYPAGYLRRIAALFPDKQKVLHLFSGKVDTTTMPVYRKADFRVEAYIGMVKSTNHRFRVVTIFRKL